MDGSILQQMYIQSRFQQTATFNFNARELGDQSAGDIMKAVIDFTYVMDTRNLQIITPPRKRIFFSKISFGSPSMGVHGTVVRGNHPNGLVSHKGDVNQHTELILFKHLSFLCYVLAVCVILLSGGYQIPGKYQGRTRYIFYQTSHSNEI